MELILEEEFQFKNIDELEIGLYLSIMIDKEDRIKEGLYDFCPIRGVGGPPIITSSRGKTSVKQWKGWTTPTDC